MKSAWYPCNTTAALYMLCAHYENHRGCSHNPPVQFKIPNLVCAGGGFPRTREGEADIESFMFLHSHNNFKNYKKFFSSPFRRNVCGYEVTVQKIRRPITQPPRFLSTTAEQRRYCYDLQFLYILQIV